LPESLSRRLAVAVIALLISAPALSAKPPSPPASKETVDEKKADLRDLRAKIDDLRKEIATAEGSRAEVADQLKDSERSISVLQRELRDLGSRKNGLQAALRDLAQESNRLEKALTVQQSQLERLLRDQYQRGAGAPLQLLLNGDDPSQLARDLHYLGIVAQVRSDVLHDTEALLKQKQSLAARTRDKAAALAAVEEQQKERHGRLLGERKQKQVTLSKLSARIAAQKKEVGSLRRDERRMSQLIERLSRLIAQQAARHRDEAKQRAARRPKSGAPELDNDELPQAAPPGSFARLRGLLRLPVKGRIGNRFGAPRQEGTLWKGLFIRSDAGNDVKAIAAGRVVFADWMRGFGNLLIIDHGDAYLSIYGNNEAVLKNVGDMVQGGDTVATVGNSGGNPDSGLYFEIRHQGQPVDPLKWASLK